MHKYGEGAGPIRSLFERYVFHLEIDFTQTNHLLSQIIIQRICAASTILSKICPYLFCRLTFSLIILTNSRQDLE